MKKVLLVLTLASSAAVAAPTLQWQLEGFDAPESVVAVPGKAQYLVSNIGGDPGEKDGNGFLSLVSASGEWIDKHWAVGLDAPKGLAISDGKVFVSDLTALRVYDLDDGTLLESLTPPDARFLNDVTATPEGDVYVSDMMGGSVYRYHEGDLSLWLRLPDIPHPNGLSVDDGQLLLGSWGKGMHADFSTDEKGGLFSIDLENQHIRALPHAQGFANIDAVARTGDNIIANDWLTGEVFVVDGNSPQVLFNAGVSAADFGVDGDRLLVPVMMENRVDVYSLE